MKGRVALFAALVAAGLFLGRQANAGDIRESFDFSHSHTLLTSFDLLDSRLAGFLGRDAQTTVSFVSNLSLNCTKSWCRQLSVVARPWVGGYAGSDGAPRQLRYRDIYENPTLRFQELHASFRPSASLSLAGGREVMGWGPGILYSPTNRMFPETMFTHEQREIIGKRLVRAAYDVPSMNLMFSVTGARVDESAWRKPSSEESRMAIARAEYQSSGAKPVNAGLVAGGGNQYRPYAGLYFQALLSDGWTVGMESSASAGYARPDAWQRFAIGLGEGAMPPLPNRQRADVLVNARYGLRSSGEIAAEVIFNGYALDRKLLPVLASIYPMLMADATAGAAFHPLFEKQYYLIQARLPKLPPAKRLTVLSSLTWARPGNGGLMYVNLTYSTDSWKVLAAFGQAFGSAQSTLQTPFFRVTKITFSYSL